jgi:hypothetical protein
VGNEIIRAGQRVEETRECRRHRPLNSYVSQPAYRYVDVKYNISYRRQTYTPINPGRIQVVVYIGCSSFNVRKSDEGLS